MKKKKTTEEFIKKAKKKYKDKYDYSKVNYVNHQSKVIIICLEHGEFKQPPSRHLGGRECPKCGRLKLGQSLSLNTEKFITKAKKVHGNKYDYSKVNYVSSDSKVTIICPEHEEFEQRAGGHLNGKGCIKCSGRATSNTEEFVIKARKIHGDKYDYSKVNYVRCQSKVIIICPEHGEFEQQPNNHLNGQDCYECGKIKNGKSKLFSTEEFIKRAKKIHGNKYDYSKIDYNGIFSKVTIICPKHGDFEQTANGHIVGKGCDKCGGSFQLNTEEFIKKAKEIHGDKYDYSKINYNGIFSKVTIICTKHGEFEQTATNHLRKSGCPRCSESKGEKRISLLLEKMGLIYKREIRYKECRFKNPLPFDFLVTVNENIKFLIEYQGIHHYEPVKRGSMSQEKANEILDEVIKRDKIKKDYAKKHKIPFIEIPYWYNKTKIEKVLLKKIEKLKGKAK